MSYFKGQNCSGGGGPPSKFNPLAGFIWYAVMQCLKKIEPTFNI